jgi:hypothetical protein
MAQYEFEPLNLPIEQKLEISQQGLWGLVARIVKIVEEKYGDEGLAALYDGLRDWELHKVSVPAMLSAHGIEPGKASPAEFVLKICNPSDDSAFVQKVKPLITDAPDENRVLYKIRSCSVADSIARECTKACRFIAGACLEGQARVANPNLKVTANKFLSEGGDACEIYVERVNE